MGQSAAFIEDNLSRLKQNLVATIVIIVIAEPKWLAESSQGICRAGGYHYHSIRY